MWRILDDFVTGQHVEEARHHDGGGEVRHDADGPRHAPPAVCLCRGWHCHCGAGGRGDGTGALHEGMPAVTPAATWHILASGWSLPETTLI